MKNNKTKNWYRGLFILIEKNDPHFNLITAITKIDMTPEGVSPETLSVFFTALPPADQNRCLQQIREVLITSEYKSHETELAIEKINLHFSHQTIKVKSTIPHEEIERVSRQLAISIKAFDAHAIDAIYRSIQLRMASETSDFNHESCLKAAIKLTALAGSAQAALAYLDRYAQEKPWTMPLIQAAISFDLPTSDDWTPAIWWRLFKQNKPNNPHELFFRIFPLAGEIEQQYKKNRRAITANTKLSALNQIAGELYYPDGRKHSAAAALFFKHRISKEAFTNYLSFTIENDNAQIQPVTIEGSAISEEHSPYYLAKLDKTNPLAAIIGLKTGCCEWISGPGNHFIEIALTEKFAGFYVLYDKRKPTNENIVAHCIAWRTEDCIIYSSIETNINYREQLLVVGDFYHLLAVELIKKHHIKRIFIGEMHGNTPLVLGVREDAPSLFTTTSNIKRDLSKIFPTMCIANLTRPHLNLYAQLRNHQALKAILTAPLSTPVAENSANGVLYNLTISPRWLFSLTNKNNLWEKIAAVDKDNDPYVLTFADIQTLSLLSKRPPSLVVQSIETVQKDIKAHVDFIINLNSIVNNLMKNEFRLRGLTVTTIRKVTSGFDYFDGVASTIRFPFRDLDCSSPESVTQYFRDFFNLCLLITELKSLLNTSFDEVRFNFLYDTIYPQHPVSCMELLRDAIRDDNEILIEAILKKGFNLNDDLCFDNTPLMFAMLHQKKNIVMKFIKHGADLNQPSRGFNNNGETPLEYAASAGLSEIFYELIIEGANPKFISRLDGSTLLHHIAKLDKLAWVSYLVKRGVDINHLNCGHDVIRPHGGHSALYEAAKADHREVFKRLIKNGADINLKNEQGNTMLHLAVINNNDKAVDLFIEFGADLSIKNHKGQTALDISKEIQEAHSRKDHNYSWHHLNNDKIFKAISTANAKARENFAPRKYSPGLFVNKSQRVLHGVISDKGQTPPPTRFS